MDILVSSKVSKNLLDRSENLFQPEFNPPPGKGGCMMSDESDLLGRKQRIKDLTEKKRVDNPKREWTEAEDKIIIENQKKLGNKWVEISKLLVKRSNVDVASRWHNALDPEAKTKKRKSSAQKTQEEVVDTSDRPAKRQKNATVKKCVKCGMEKKKRSYLIEEWDKLEDNERICQVCTKKEGKRLARFDPAVRRELDQAVRRLEEKQAAEKKRLEQEKKAAAEVQSRLSAHQQMEQIERVTISVVRSKKVELGLGVGKRDDRMVVTSISPGIFDGSQLGVGMIIDSVNGSCPLSYKDALRTLQNAEGRINIVALSRAKKNVPVQGALGGSKTVRE